MIYFDNAATGGFKPDCVTGAAYAALRNCANPGRSGHRRSLACAERVYACRKAIASFFGAPSPDRVAFTKNCTEALNIAILGGVGSGGKIVSTVAEHNSVLRPLQYLEDMGTNVELAPLTADGRIDCARLISMAQDAKAVIVTLASNVTGTSPDIAKIKANIPQDCLLICDGAQACGHQKIDISALGIDALAVAGHKGMMGIQGSGALIMSARCHPRPIMFGGTGSASYDLDMPDFYPDRLEAGTLSYPAIVSLGEGVLWLSTRLYENRDYLVYLTDKLLRGLEEIPFITLYSRTNPFGIVAFDVRGMPSEEVAERLSREHGICVRGGLHCAPLMHGALGTSGLVRASLSPFNTAGEVEYFLKAVRGLHACA